VEAKPGCNQFGCSGVDGQDCDTRGLIQTGQLGLEQAVFFLDPDQDTAVFQQLTGTVQGNFQQICRGQNLALGGINNTGPTVGNHSGRGIRLGFNLNADHAGRDLIVQLFDQTSLGQKCDLLLGLVAEDLRGNQGQRGRFRCLALGDADSGGQYVRFGDNQDRLAGLSGGRRLSRF